MSRSRAGRVRVLVVGVALLAAGLVVGRATVWRDAGADLPGRPAVGAPFELEADVELTIDDPHFDDRRGRLRAVARYDNRTTLSYTSPQFALACAERPEEHEWADATLEGSVAALGAIEAEARGGGEIVLAYDPDRLAACARTPVLWIRSGVMTDLPDGRGHRTTSIELERPARS